jgi:hypothetical protein
LERLVPGSEQRRRRRVKSVRFSPEELARLEADAARAGLTVGSYVRFVVLQAPVPRQARRPPVERELLSKALGELGKVGSNVNQIAKHLNSGRSVPDFDIAAALAELHVAKDELMAALGRGTP